MRENSYFFEDLLRKSISRTKEALHKFELSYESLIGTKNWKIAIKEVNNIISELTALRFCITEMERIERNSNMETKYNYTDVMSME